MNVLLFTDVLFVIHDEESALQKSLFKFPIIKRVLKQISCFHYFLHGEVFDYDQNCDIDDTLGKFINDLRSQALCFINKIL